MWGGEFQVCATCQLADWPERMVARDGLFFCGQGCLHAYMYDRAEWQARFMAERGLQLALATVQFGRRRLTALDFEDFRALHVQLTLLVAHCKRFAATARVGAAARRLLHYLSGIWEYHCGQPVPRGAHLLTWQ